MNPSWRRLLSHFVFTKKIELFDGIERLTLRCRFDYRIHLAKMELFEQINDLSISFSSKGFFVMDRPFLGEVSSFPAIPQCHCWPLRISAVGRKRLVRYRYSTVLCGRSTIAAVVKWLRPNTLYQPLWEYSIDMTSRINGRIAWLTKWCKKAISEWTVYVRWWERGLVCNLLRQKHCNPNLLCYSQVRIKMLEIYLILCFNSRIRNQIDSRVRIADQIIDPFAWAYAVGLSLPRFIPNLWRVIGAIDLLCNQKHNYLAKWHHYHLR